MAFSIGDLIARVGADISGFRSAMSDVSSTLDKTAAKMGTAGAAMTAAFTVPLTGVAVAAIKTAGELEQNAIAFKTMIGSADAAQKHLESLRDFAAKTPFQFTDLVLASKRMQALGFDAKQVVPILTNVGDAAAALGMGADGIQRIITALGQMQAKGKVQAEEMRQLAEAGIPAWQILAKTLKTDVAGAMKAVEDRTVDAATAIPALLAGMNAKFGGLMEQQAKTLLGTWSDLKDKLTFALTDVGTALLPIAKRIMESVLKPMLAAVKDLASWFGQLSPSVQNTILTLGALTAAAGPLLLGISGLVTSLGALQTVLVALGPLAINPVALAIAGLTGAVVVLYSAFRDLRAESERQQKVFDDWIVSLGAGARTAKGVADAQQKINEALEKGLISKETAAKALEMLADREKKIVGSQLNESLGLTGVKLSVVSTESEKTTKSLDALKSAFTQLGLKDLNAELDLSVKSFAVLVASGKLTHEQMLQAAGAIAKLRGELASVRNIALVDIAPGRNATLDELRGLPGSTDVSTLPTINRNVELLNDSLGAMATEEALAARNAENLDEAMKTTGKTSSVFARQISTVFTDLSRSIADVALGTKKLSELWRDTGKAIVRIIVEQIIGYGFSKLVSFLKDTVLPHLGAVGKAIGGILGGGVSAGASAAGSAASGAGSAASGAGSAATGAASGVAGTLTAIGSIGSMVSGFIGNAQFAGMNKSLDVLVNHTLRIFNELFQFRADAWMREEHLMRKLDDIWNSIRDVGKGGGSPYFDFRGATFGAGLSQSQVNSMMQIAYQQAKLSLG